MSYCLSKAPYFSRGEQMPVPTYRCGNDDWVNLPINLSNKDQTYVFAKCEAKKAVETCGCPTCVKAREAAQKAQSCACATCIKAAEEAKARANQCPCGLCQEARKKVETCPCNTCKEAQKQVETCPCGHCAEAKKQKETCPCGHCAKASEWKKVPSPFASSWSPFNNYSRDVQCYQSTFFSNFRSIM